MNSSIMSYLFFRSWIYSLTYSIYLSNYNFTMTRYVIHVIFSLKSLKNILCLSFCICRYYFCTYFVSIVLINSHSLFIRTCVLTHFSWNMLNMSWTILHAHIKTKSWDICCHNEKYWKDSWIKIICWFIFFCIWRIL